MQEQPAIKDIRIKAQTMLGFKCPEGPIKDCLRRNEIPIRRSKAEAERQLLIDRIDELEELCLDLLAHGQLPPSLIRKFKDRSQSLTGRVMEALSKRAEQVASQ